MCNLLLSSGSFSIEHMRTNFKSIQLHTRLIKSLDFHEKQIIFSDIKNLSMLMMQETSNVRTTFFFTIKLLKFHWIAFNFDMKMNEFVFKHD